MHLQPSNELKLKYFINSNWANDVKNKKSISGFVVMFANTLVAWKSRKQTSVAISPVEAEFISLSELCSCSIICNY